MGVTVRCQGYYKGYNMLLHGKSKIRRINGPRLKIILRVPFQASCQG